MVRDNFSARFLLLILHLFLCRSPSHSVAATEAGRASLCATTVRCGARLCQSSRALVSPALIAGRRHQCAGNTAGVASLLCRAAAVALDMDTTREGAAAGDLRHGRAEWRVAMAANESAGGAFASAQGLLAG